MTLNMRQARLVSGKTQKECANLFGVCDDTYRKIEQNPRRITIVQARAFSDFVGVPMDSINFDTGSI